jgi:hypothetical protein
MLSKPSYTTNKNTPVGQGKNVVLARTGAFYGIKIEGIRQESSSYKRGIVAIPNFYFYDNQTKVMIDFSDFKNSIDQTLVEEFFNLSLTGISMDVTNGQWENLELSSRKITLDGTYTIDSYKGDILFANVIDVPKLDPNINRYDKSYFLNTPDFTLDVSTTQSTTKKFSIVNYLGENSKNSFNYLGVIPGDYIRINNSNSKYEVEDLYSDEEGKEVIVLKGTLSPDDRRTKLTDVAVYCVNDDNVDTSNLDNVEIGKCNINENGIILCFDSNTSLQCQLRNSKLKNKVASFTKDTFCPTESVITQRTTAVDQLTSIAKETNTILSNVLNSRRI